MSIRDKRPQIELPLTDEQKQKLTAFVAKSNGDARLDVEVVFKADVKRGVIAPATFLVGAAL